MQGVVTYIGPVEPLATGIQSCNFIDLRNHVNNKICKSKAHGIVTSCENAMSCGNSMFCLVEIL